MCKNNIYVVEKELDDFYRDGKVDNSNLKLLLKFPVIETQIKNLGELKIIPIEDKKINKVIITQKNNKKGLF